MIGRRRARCTVRRSRRRRSAASASPTSRLTCFSCCARVRPRVRALRFLACRTLQLIRSPRRPRARALSRRCLVPSVTPEPLRCRHQDLRRGRPPSRQDALPSVRCPLSSLALSARPDPRRRSAQDTARRAHLRPSEAPRYLPARTNPLGQHSIGTVQRCRFASSSARRLSRSPGPHPLDARPLRTSLYELHPLFTALLSLSSSSPSIIFAYVPYRRIVGIRDDSGEEPSLEDLPTGFQVKRVGRLSTAGAGEEPEGDVVKLVLACLAKVGDDSGRLGAVGLSSWVLTTTTPLDHGFLRCM